MGATHAVGRRAHCATVPLRVPWNEGPITASGRKRRITSIDSFFSGIRRGTGTRAPSSGRTSPNSSDNRRHPEWTSAVHKVDLPWPDQAGNRMAEPPRSTTAECSISKWLERVATHQLMPHSSAGSICAAGRGQKGLRPSAMKQA